jgi:hypothetical protein
MITITNNNISIPQGETAVVSFSFVDIKTNAPLILSGKEFEHSIHVVVKDQISTDGEDILHKMFIVESDLEHAG